MTTGAPRTVLVTGGAGFIGSALCTRLQADGHRVIVYDNLSRGRHAFLPSGTRLVEGDIRDAAACGAVVREHRPDAVVHLAAMHFIPDCVANPEATLAINVDGTRHVLDACRDTTVGAVVFASSAAVYAVSDAPCVEDRTPLGPVEIYGESKVAGEALLAAFHEETGVTATALRFFNAVGRRETNPHVIPHIFESLQRSDEIPLGNMDAQRDYIDSRDVAGAISAALALHRGHRVLNVGTGEGHAVSEIVDRLRRILGRPIVVRQDAARLRPVERMRLVADTSRAAQELGWRAGIRFDDVLADLCGEYGLRRS